jgi:hypothetical protein
MAPEAEPVGNARKKGRRKPEARQQNGEFSKTRGPSEIHFPTAQYQGERPRR